MAIVAVGSSERRNVFPVSKKNVLSKRHPNFMDKMKKASKSVVDAGAKQMLKVRTDSNNKTTDNDGANQNSFFLL